MLFALIVKHAYLKSSDVFVCSLENIYKELSTDIEGFTHPGHGDLTGWAKQGELKDTLVMCHEEVWLEKNLMVGNRPSVKENKF